jgi:asparagine synthetase B (glutamine-hydrolysing)
MSDYVLLASVRNPFSNQFSRFLSSLSLNLCNIDSGAQPLVNEDETIFLTVNGEIYNHRLLRRKLKGDEKFITHSDCEVILHLVKSN